jgi:hypothetical protein
MFDDMLILCYGIKDDYLSAYWFISVNDVKETNNLTTSISVANEYSLQNPLYVIDTEEPCSYTAAKPYRRHMPNCFAFCFRPTPQNKNKILQPCCLLVVYFHASLL